MGNDGRRSVVDDVGNAGRQCSGDRSGSILTSAVSIVQTSVRLHTVVNASGGVSDASARGRI